MNPIIAALVLSYGTPYIVKYIAEYLGYKLFKYTANAVTNTVSNKVFKKNNNSPPIEYEYVSIDNDSNEPIFDDIYIVNSKDRTKSIDQSWYELDLKKGK